MRDILDPRQWAVLDGLLCVCCAVQAYYGDPFALALSIGFGVLFLREVYGLYTENQ